MEMLTNDGDDEARAALCRMTNKMIVLVNLPLYPTIDMILRFDEFSWVSNGKYTSLTVYGQVADNKWTAHGAAHEHPTDINPLTVREQLSDGPRTAH